MLDAADEHLGPGDGASGLRQPDPQVPVGELEQAFVEASKPPNDVCSHEAAARSRPVRSSSAVPSSRTDRGVPSSVSPGPETQGSARSGFGMGRWTPGMTTSEIRDRKKDEAQVKFNHQYHLGELEKLELIGMEKQPAKRGRQT